MSVDLDAMHRLAANFYMREVHDKYGESGVETLLEVFNQLHRIYEHVDPEGILGSLTVFRALNEDTLGALVIATASDAAPQRFSTAEHLTRGFSKEARMRDMVIQVCLSGDLLLSPVTDLDMDALAEHGVVYIYHSRADYVRVSGFDRRIPKLDSTHASMFAIPTFRSLREALEGYKWEMIRTSQCPIFSGAWETGRSNDRLFFRSGRAEDIMRDSLTYYLKISLRSIAEVRPEQNMDESHPVDIKVSWTLSKKIALIEVKWLGKARNEEGRVTRVHTASRAGEGAQQLAEYLDQNASQAPTLETKGYLVVIDARRYGLNEKSETINREQGMYYANEEIDYDPKYHELREDFEEPIRMFAEPICRES
jgi:hypothetical protein